MARSKRTWYLLGGAAVVGLVVVLHVAGLLLLSARARLARYLDIRDTSSAETIEAELVKGVRLGTSIEGVQEFLEKRGLRQGGGATRYYFTDESGLKRDIGKANAIACVFDYNAGVVIFGKEKYLVWFMFDEKNRLQRIKVFCQVDDI